MKVTYRQLCCRSTPFCHFYFNSKLRKFTKYVKSTFATTFTCGIQCGNRYVTFKISYAEYDIIPLDPNIKNPDELRECKHGIQLQADGGIFNFARLYQRSRIVLGKTVVFIDLPNYPIFNFIWVPTT